MIFQLVFPQGFIIPELKFRLNFNFYHLDHLFLNFLALCSVAFTWLS